MMKKLMASSLVTAVLLVGSVSSAFANEEFNYEKGHDSTFSALVTDGPTPASVKSAAVTPALAPDASFNTAPQGTTAATSQADKLLAYAQSLQGKVHYSYAKRITLNPNNLILDCSSYTQYVFKQTLGISIPWGSNAQHNAFSHVAKSNLQKGDLLFFSVGSGKSIGHVGIYMGNGKFIHNVNPSSNVTISDLNSSNWSRHYIDASRVLK